MKAKEFKSGTWRCPHPHIHMPIGMLFKKPLWITRYRSHENSPFTNIFMQRSRVSPRCCNASPVFAIRAAWLLIWGISFMGFDSGFSWLAVTIVLVIGFYPVALIIYP